MSIPGEWFRRARYLINRRRIEDDLRREMEAHREMMRDARALRQHAAAARGRARRLGLALARRSRAGRSATPCARCPQPPHVRHYGGARCSRSASASPPPSSASSAAWCCGRCRSRSPIDWCRCTARPSVLPRGCRSRTSTRYRRDSTSFEAVAGYEVGARYLRDAGGTERVMAVRTERDFFAVLGVPALYGRTYDATDSGAGRRHRRDVLAAPLRRGRRHHRPRAGAGRAALHRHRHHAGRGSSTRTGPARCCRARPSTTRTDLWMPFDRPLSPRGRIGSVTGRLKPGVSLAAAQSELNVIAKRLEAQDPAQEPGTGHRHRAAGAGGRAGADSTARACCCSARW